MPSSLYIHIPFCRHLCSYCDFSKVLYEERWCFSYLESLKEEILSYPFEKPLKTIYIGGGTPSLLPLKAIEELLAFLKPYCGKDTEWTMEANPEDLNEEKLLAFYRGGINRLSVGIESSNPRLLKLMGRNHTFLEAKEAVKRSKEIGFKRISCDMIYGLPNESEEELLTDIHNFLGLEVTHLSAYCLSVNPGTLFFNKGYKEMEEERAGLQYERILGEFRQAGFRRYEISNFAKDGDFSKHNLVYWHDEEYFGAGLGASGYYSRTRYQNTKNLTKYLSKKWLSEIETLDTKSELEDFFLTNLRLDNGFSLETFKNRFGFDFLQRFQSPFEDLHKKKLLTNKNGRIFATDRGLEILDSLLLELF